MLVVLVLGSYLLGVYWDFILFLCFYDGLTEDYVANNFLFASCSPLIPFYEKSGPCVINQRLRG